MAAAGREAMLESAPAKKGMSRRCKLCIGCSVGAAVVLAVAIPVGICVVGPKIAQQAIDWSVLHIHHSNIFDVPDSGANGTMYNAITIHSPSIFPATLQEMTVTLVAHQPNTTGYGFTNGPFGNFTMPKTKVHKGDSMQNWTAPILFNHTADFGLRFVFWTLMVSSYEVARINLTAEPVVKTFGLSFKTKMTKTLVCNCVPSKGCVPEKKPFNASATFAEHSFGLGDIAPINLFCEPEGTDVHNGTQWAHTGLMRAAAHLSDLADHFLA